MSERAASLEQRLSDPGIRIVEMSQDPTPLRGRTQSGLRRLTGQAGQGFIEVLGGVAAELVVFEVDRLGGLNACALGEAGVSFRAWTRTSAENKHEGMSRWPPNPNEEWFRAANSSRRLRRSASR